MRCSATSAAKQTGGSGKRDRAVGNHCACRDALVPSALDGKGRITIDGKDYELAAGVFIVMPANVNDGKMFHEINPHMSADGAPAMLWRTYTSP